MIVISRTMGVVWLGGMVAGQALAQAPVKALRFWNTTAATIVSLEVAPAGTGNWSANLCLSDPDHSVEPDERLSMSGIAAGRYDVRVADSGARRCLFRNVPIKVEGPYALLISEAQMKDCAEKK